LKKEKLLEVPAGAVLFLSVERKPTLKERHKKKPTLKKKQLENLH